MTIYGGLDVSDKRTHICVIDGITVTVPSMPGAFRLVRCHRNPAGICAHAPPRR